MGTWQTFSSAAEGYDIKSVSKMEASSRILDRNGTPLGSLQFVDRKPVPLSSMSEWITSAIIATEDARFRLHHGVDPIGIARAMLKNITGGSIRQGASTITQQLARDSFNIRERTYRRKLLEMALAIRLERLMSKDQILELYLNRIYFGGGLYGIEAASQGYLGKPASALNPSEAAMLASMVRSPNALSPWRNPSRTESARRLVLDQMASQGMLTSSQLKGWLDSAPQITPRNSDKGDSYVVESVRLAVGRLVDTKLVMGGGLTIKTTLDSALQSASEQALREHSSMVESRPEMSRGQTMAQFSSILEKSPPSPGEPNRIVPSYLQASLSAVDNLSGGILAMVGGRSFLHSEYNRALQSRRPPSGLFTPFLILSALEASVGSHQPFEDWPLDNMFVGVGGSTGVLGEWSVETEDNSYEGPLTMRQLMLSGKNAASARLGFSVGAEVFTQVSTAAGFVPPKEFRASSYVEGLPATPTELALAYTVFSRLGTRPASAFLVSEILDPSGAVLYRHQPAEVRVSSPQSAWLVGDMLREGLTKGPSSRVADFSPTLSGVGVRAGTSYGFEDVWFAGYDSRLSLVVWMGFDRPAPLFRGAFGSQLAAPLWAQVMRHARGALATNSSPAMPEKMGKFDICPTGHGLLTEGCPPPSSPVSEFSQTPGPPPCSLHSGSATLVERREEGSPWPRAQQLVDNRFIRPVNIGSGYIHPQSDPYKSVSPSSLASARVRVESAQPVPTTAPPASPASLVPSPAPIPIPISPPPPKTTNSPVPSPAPDPPLKELSLDP